MMKNTIYISALCLMLTSCVKEDNGKGGRIGLQAGVSGLEISTRAAVAAAPFKGAEPDKSNPLEAAVWFSYDSADFDDSPQGPTYIPCHTTMRFDSNGLTYASTTIDDASYDLSYPTTDEHVYCVGFHPATGWNTTDGVNVTHVIDGSEDLMFADIREGSWNDHIDAQEYRHQLTWIKVNVCAMTKETALQWGNVTNVSISSKDQITVNLGETSGKVSYGGNDQFITAYEDAEGLALSMTSQEAGSIFCSPSKEYIVKVTTENQGEKSVTITLTDLEYQELTTDEQAKGKLFILSLYFNPFAILEGTCTLNYWNNSDEDLFLQ